jgi:hypothetical protein
MSAAHSIYELLTYLRRAYAEDPRENLRTIRTRRWEEIAPVLFWLFASDGSLDQRVARWEQQIRHDFSGEEVSYAHLRVGADWLSTFEWKAEEHRRFVLAVSDLPW